RGGVERRRPAAVRTSHGSFEIFKTDFWGQGPVLLQALAILQGFDLERMGHNSTEYIHTVTEALKLALADRDAFYGDPDFAKIPVRGLLSDAYLAERRALIDPRAASSLPHPGDPWRCEPGASLGIPGRERADSIWTTGPPPPTQTRAGLHAGTRDELLSPGVGLLDRTATVDPRARVAAGP